jgi:hypothetical protein
MRELFEGLVTRGRAKDTSSRIRYWGKWRRGHLENMREGKKLGHDFPAVFFEFVSPGEVLSIGGGVQMFDPVFVRVHVIHKFLNNTEGGTELNLDYYDLGKEVHGWFEGYKIEGADYGSSPMNRTSVEDDDEDDNLYQYRITYSTTWTDNSLKWPRGGYEQDPVFNGVITGEITQPDSPALTVNKASIAFGDVEVGESATDTFTVAGTNLEGNLIISTTDGEFLITFNGTYRTRLDMNPVDEEIEETTVTVKFTPATTGAKTADILYGVPGINGSISLTGSGI